LQLSGHSSASNSNDTCHNRTPGTTRTSNRRVNKTKILTPRNKTIATHKATLAMANFVHTARYLTTHRKNAEKE